MKCKYYLCMMLFSFMVLFHQYSLVKADETESTLTQKYFKLYADMTGKWDEKDGFIYRYSEKDNHAVIVAMNMDKKVITIPEKIDGKTVTELNVYPKNSTGQKVLIKKLIKLGKQKLMV